MKLTASIAIAIAATLTAAEPEKWVVVSKEPLVLPGWGTVRDLYGLARFSQKDKSLTVEVAGGGADHHAAEPLAPAIQQEVEGDFEALLTIQPGMIPGGRHASTNRVLWNGAGLLVEPKGNNFIRHELTIRRPKGQKEDNRIWAMNVRDRSFGFQQPELKNWDSKTPLHLRVRRTGAAFVLAYSFDRTTWVNADAFEFPKWPAKLKVGPLFVNLTTKVQKVTVSDFTIVSLNPQSASPRPVDAK